MFTGIIEEVGKIEKKSPDGANEGVIWELSCSFSQQLSLGESVAIDGICHTVTSMSKDSFTVFSSLQTLEITHLGDKKEGSFVNLERSLRVGDRLSGHMVYGHVDGVCVLKDIEVFEKSKLYHFKVDDSKAMEYMVKKGSVALNGTSLTIYDKTTDGFTVMIIEHTFYHTTFQYLKKNDRINLELDIVGKYIKGF